MNQSLSQYNSRQQSITINGHEITLSTNNLTETDDKDSKYSFIIPTDTDQFLHYVNNFCFTTASFVKETSYLYLQWDVASEILNESRFVLASLGSTIQTSLQKYYITYILGLKLISDLMQKLKPLTK